MTQTPSPLLSRTSAEPRYSTPRTPSRLTEGPEIAAAASLYAGGPLMPWQRMIADIAGERLDGPGSPFAYDQVVIVVGRRAGKTRLTHGVPLRRALGAITSPVVHPVTGQRVPYLAAATAQNMTSATKRLRETWDRYRTAAPVLAERSRMLTGVNHAAIELDHRHRIGGRWQSNPWASRLSVFPPTAHAVRGDEYLFLSVDEALTLSAEDGQEIAEAARPALSTYAGHAQLWYLSNEGKDAGGYLSILKALGREAASAGVTTGTAYFEWSMAADDDPTDPRVWHAAHPALGYTITEAALARDLEVLGVDAFAREYLGLQAADPDALPVTPEQWAAAQSPGLALPAAGAVLGADASVDRQHAAVAAAWRSGETLNLGIRWTGEAARLRPAAEAQRTRTGAPVYFDTLSAGPAASGTQWRAVTLAQLCAGSTMILEHARAGTLRVHPDDALTAAVLAARLRVIRHAGSTFDRKDPAADISPLMAAAIACAGLTAKRPDPVMA